MSITANKVIRRILSRKKQKTNKARILTGVVKNTRIDVLDIQVEIGLESAVSTAVVCGQTLAVLLTLAKNFTPNARAEVKPCFDEKKLSLRGKAEISFNIANVIAIAIYCLPKHSKGERKWKNILSKT